MALFKKVDADKAALAIKRENILEKFKLKIETLQYQYRVTNDELCEKLDLSKAAFSRFMNTKGKSLRPHRILILENWAAEIRLTRKR